MLLEQHGDVAVLRMQAGKANAMSSRMLTALAFQHLNKAVPQGFIGVQASLFEEDVESE